MLVVSACASGARGAGSSGAAPLPGDNYSLVYHASGAVYRRDTRVGVDEPVVRDVSEPLLAVASPTARHVALAYRHGGASRVVVIETESGSVADVHEGTAGTVYTMAWSPEGERLGVGFQSNGGRGGVKVLETGGAARDIGCVASNRFVAWRSPAEVMVSDGGKFYAVRTSDCATLTTFARLGKSDLAYAQNGTRVAYYQDRSVKFVNRPQPEVIPELWIAGHDGMGAKVIADYQSRPRNSAWAPDAGRIVYEVVSRRWANTTHLVIYDVRSDAYSYEASEKELGVPSDFGACWSPDGRRIAHERTYARNSAVQTYTTRQVVVRDGADETVVLDEVIGEALDQVLAAGLSPCRWVGPRHLLVATRGGQRVIGVDDGQTYEVSPDRHVLAVRVFAGAP